jgi:hypothetical protein
MTFPTCDRIKVQLQARRQQQGIKQSHQTATGGAGEKLVRERGAGSGEQGFHLQIVWNFDDHGEADLLPWIINV